MAKANSGGWLDNIKTIVYAVLIAVVIRTVGFEPFHIPSGSMIPTLLVGDYLFVSKYSYGFSRYSMPFSPNLFSGRIFGSLPKRGDVVVFKNMHADYEDYIKRIVGLPGDRIQVRGGILNVNGQPVGIRPVGDVRVSSDYGTFMDEKEYVETLPGNVSHLIAKMGSEGPQNNTPEYVVPEGNLFAMGDNRDNSLDSRFSGDSSEPGLRQSQGVGYLPIENLVGRAEFIFFSIDATEPVWQIWQWPFEIRWSRLLTGIR